MSTTVDKKVVEMQFDNKNFESNVQTSMSTIEKLKQALHFDGFADGLNRITSAAGRVDLSPLGDAADAVSSKFSALETMAVGALMRIGSNAVDVAGKLVKSLSIDQVTAGWNKYDEITKSTQTIMAATAKDWDNQEEQLEYVNKQLEKLNWFTDETSYNLSDMVNNISKFTSNGIALDKATTSMEGIATWAALSGAGIQEMSRAMYNISQATGVGYMSLIDWKSIQNANMATQEFKQTVIDTAEQMGTIKKGAVTIENFADNLSKGKWFTNDVLDVVLGKYGEFTDQLYELYNAFWDVGEEITTSQILDLLEEYKKGELDLAQVSDDTALSLDFLREAFDNLAASDMGLGEKGFRAAQEAKTFQEAIDATKDAVSTGWMNTFKIIFGDYLEAKRLWTDLANTMWDVFASGGEARNNLLAEWKALGGRDLLFANTEEDVGALWQLYNAFQSVAGPIHEAWEQIFPPITAERLVELTQKFKDFTERLKLSEKNQENLKKTFEGLFSVLKIGKQIISALLSPIKSVLGLTDGMGTTILGVTGSIGEWITKLASFTEENNIFGKAVDTIVGKIKMGWNAIKGFFTGLTEKWNLPKLDGVSNFFKTLKDGIKNVDFTSIDSFKESFKKLGQDLGSAQIFQKLRDGFGSVKQALESAQGWVKATYDKIRSIFEGSKLQDLVLKAWNKIKETFESAKGYLKNAIPFIKGKIKELKDSLPKNDSRNGGIIGFLKTLWDLIKKVGSAVFKAFGETFGDVFQKLANLDFNKITEFIKLLTTGGLAVALHKIFSNLTGASKSIKDVFDAFGGKKHGIKAILENVEGVLESYQTKLKAGTLMKIAGAIAILAASIVALALVDANKLDHALGAITAMFAELVGVFEIIEHTGASSRKASKNVSMLIKVAASVLILAIALKEIAELEPEQMKTGILGILGLTAILVAAFKTLEAGSGKGIKGATGLLVMAAAIKVLASACIDLAALDWEALGKGLAGIAGIMTELGLFVKALTGAKGLVGKGFGLIEIAAAITILVSSVKSLSKMSWEEIGRGLTGLAGALTAVSIATRIMPSGMVSKGLGLIAVATAITIISNAVKNVSGMEWQEIGKGLTVIGGSMLILAIGLNLMKNTLAGSAALLVASVALATLAPVIKSLGSLSWESIAKGLVTMAGAFAVIGIAGALLAPIVPAILALGAALVVIGAGIVVLGGGLTLVGTGLMLVAAGVTALVGSVAVGGEALVAAIGAILVGIVDLIPMIVEKIADGTEVFAESLKRIIIALIGVLEECIDPAVEAVLKFIVSLLEKTKTYIPQIITLVLDLVIQILEAIRDKIPELTAVAVDIIVQFFASVTDALLGYDTSVLLKALGGIGIVAALILGIAAIAPLIPAAMAGVLGVGAFVAELALVLAAIGALEQIPGLHWLIDEGGELLGAIGKAIGEFAGSIVGGMAEGISNGLPGIGENLSKFMDNLKPFIEGANQIDPASMNGLKSIAEAILVITAADILDGVTHFLTGKGGLSKFGEELAAFGPHFKTYADSVAGIDTDAVTASANAAEVLAKMADIVPKVGGVAAFFAGENSLAVFGEELAGFGPKFRVYANSIKGIDTEAVTSSANAAETLARMAEIVPKIGGLISKVEGENSLASFGEELALFGPKFRVYANSIKGISNESVIASAAAVDVLSKMASDLPPHGGFVQALTGDNSLFLFGQELASFGPKFKIYADSLKGVNSFVVTASAAAIDAVAKAASELPKYGGFVQALTGQNSLFLFGEELAGFGPKFKAYADSINGLNVGIVRASASAVEAVAKMAKELPESSGFVQLWTGEYSLTKLGEELATFGPKFKEYADSLDGIHFGIVTASARAVEAISNMASNLPKENGFISLFTGDNSLSKFGEELAGFGPHFKTYADSIKGIDAESVTASAAALTAISALQAGLTEEGGLKQIFTGSKSLSNLASGLSDLGNGIKSYADSVKGFDEAAMVSVGFSVKSANALSGLQSSLTESGGFFSIFTGDQKFSNLSDGMSDLGKALKEYLAQVKNFSDNDVSAVSRSVTIADSLTGLQKAIVGEGGLQELWSGKKDLGSFGETLVSIGQSMKKFVNEVKYLNHATITNTVNSINRIVDMCKNMTGSELSRMTGFSTGLESMANDGITKFVNAFDGAETRFREAAERVVNTFKLGITLKKSDFINEFKTLPEEAIAALRGFQQKFYSEGSREVLDIRDGANSKTEHLTLAFRKLAKASVEALRESGQAFYNAGANAAQGYIDGMNSRQSSVSNTSSNMARVSAAAARKELQIHSPSKVYYQIGEYAVEGYVKALDDGTFSVIQTLEDGTERSIDAFVKVLEDHTVVARDSGQAFGEAMENGILGALKKDAEIQEAVTNLALDTVSSPAWIGHGVFDATEDRLRELGLKLPEDSPAINNLLSGDPITTTITPVIDLTDAEEGAAELNEMLNGTTSINLADATGENLAKIIENQNEMLKAQNTIIDEINEFQEQFGGLSEKIENLRMYLDGDKLVGGLINRIDRALGQNEILVGRGM